MIGVGHVKRCASTKVNVYLGCDPFDHGGEAVDSCGHGASVVGNGEQAGAGECPRAGAGPCLVVDPGCKPEHFPGRGIEDAPGVEKVHGPVADADAAEVDRPDNRPSGCDKRVSSDKSVSPAGRLGGGRNIAKAPPRLANTARVEPVPRSSAACSTHRSMVSVTGSPHRYPQRSSSCWKIGGADRVEGLEEPTRTRQDAPAEIRPARTEGLQAPRTRPPAAGERSR